MGTQSNIEKAETVANILQMAINAVSKHYGGTTGQAFSNFLTGNGAVTTSIGDLVDKINKGTAKPKDVADALQDVASIIAGFGVMAGYANPWVFGALTVVGVVKGFSDYVNANPELEKEIGDIFSNPSVENFVDIWEFFDKKYSIESTLNSPWEEFQGGHGFDKYIAHNGDSISDDDGLGSVYLGGEHLDGGEKKVIKHIGVTTTNYTKTFTYCECKTVTKWSDVTTNEWKEKEKFYIDKATGTKYILSGSTLNVISSAGTITINNFSNGQLGIHLSEKETIDKKNVERDVFLQEDFCSPLILDINNNGTSSTGLGNSQTYFDMDGDGFKERTAWVEQGDGMLVLDRNGNGTIDNGTELFGNFTPLASGNSASDGFEALLQYDENHDGKIDRNDAAYNQLKVWKDDNANGITDTGELKTLQEANVASVKLNTYYKSQKKAA